MEKIRARMIFEAMGKPANMVEKALKNLIKEMKGDGKTIDNDKYSKPKKVGKVFFSAFVECEVLCKDLAELLGAVMDYVPVNVEIISPDKVSIDMSDLQDILNDLTSRMDNLDKQIKVLQASNIVLQKQLKGITTKK